MKIIIINGANLNLLGKREPEIYGHLSFEEFFKALQNKYVNKIELEYFQSNCEGQIIDKIHQTGFSYDAILLNPGAFSHYSYAILDAVKAVKTPVVEVHISNLFAREEHFRHKSVITAGCKALVCGFGLEGYRIALDFFCKN